VATTPALADVEKGAVLAEVLLDEVLPPVAISELPFVALDNTCNGGKATDISGCTGMLSGSPAREYHLYAREGQRLNISLEPGKDLLFDVSFALLDGAGNCVLGRDVEEAGWAERALTPRLHDGWYRLIIGGYRDDCGPYTLTVRGDLPEPAQVTDVNVRTDPKGSLLRWNSFAEVDVAYFGVYRSLHDVRERIAVVRPHGSPASFASYRYLDRGTQPDARYEVELVLTDGRTQSYTIPS
jgi:hypothetical protein